MRDGADNFVVICSIENIDPMGVHTGDSITVAPVQTLRDREYQRMRDAAFRIMDLVGIWGGANVQFAIEPESGRMVVIEMNPRVSRSSALASKATGYPIAKVAARLALGYTLHELPNDVVGTIPAAFEPSLDYVVVKIPRWNFEKFHGVDDALGSSMQSIGEVMALGRTFNEALQKALRSLENDWSGLDTVDFDERELERLLAVPNSMRIFAVKAAYRAGWTTPRVHALTKIDPWFLENFRVLVEHEAAVRALPFPPSREAMRAAKQFGFSDRQLGALWGVDEDEVVREREAMGILPVVKMVDTCAGEFEARTPYYYVVYDEECDLASDARRHRSLKQKVVILGSGPNRIGQGIEFDYCCVHAAMALREMGYESIMVNCNPETVSTDFDISDRLYFEPVSYEHVMAIVAKEKPLGVIFQFGGQTPLKLLHRLARAGVPVLGTGVEAVDRAEDRERCQELMLDLGIKHPPCAFASTREETVRAASQLGYPVLLRPPYVLGGRSMELVRSEDEILSCVDSALASSGNRALMIDKFIEGAVEVDVDCVSDGENVVIAGIMEHMEEAGIHSGDSSCVLPPLAIEEEIADEIKRQTIRIARTLRVVGMMNAQFAIKDNRIYCFEVNPRASRTVPYVSKATGVQWIKVATRAVMGEKIDMARYGEPVVPDYMSVKAPVFPFDKFPGVDSILGPEMRSTGEVMGIGETFDEAFIKAQLGAGYRLPKGSHVFISVANRYKRKVIFPVKALCEMGYKIVSTPGMAKVLRSHGVAVRIVHKLSEGDYGILEMIEDGTVTLVVNMAWSRQSVEDDKYIRLAANKMKVPCITTMAGFHALVLGLQTVAGGPLHVESIQNYNARLRPVIEADHATGAAQDAIGEVA
jgi:carbamoyl-phosphate synthase large subunit